MRDLENDVYPTSLNVMIITIIYISHNIQIERGGGEEEIVSQIVISKNGTSSEYLILV